VLESFIVGHYVTSCTVFEALSPCTMLHVAELGLASAADLAPSLSSHPAAGPYVARKRAYFYSVKYNLVSRDSLCNLI